MDFYRVVKHMKEGASIMKFSVLTDMLGTEVFEEALKQTRNLGFPAIELRAKLDGNTIDKISLEEARVLKEKVDRFELQVSTLSSWAVNPCTFSGPPKYDNYDEEHHNRMSDILDRLCDVADVLDASYIRVYSLYRQENFNELPDEEKEKQYKHNASIMRKHAEQIERRSKVLLVENEPPTLSSTLEELGKLVQYANHPNLKINWDIINGWRAGEYPTAALYEQHIKGHVGQTHLKGAVTKEGSISKENPEGSFGNFAIAGQDDFDHKSIIEAIAKGDPEAIMTIDTHYPSLYEQDKIGEVEVMRRCKQFFDSILAEVNASD